MPRTVSVIADGGVGDGLLAKFRVDVTLADRAYRYCGQTVSAPRDELVWIDCEMTGLDLGSDKLIEIAALVTDGDLNILGEGVDVVIHADDAALAAMPPVVADMHAKSGLTQEVRTSVVTLQEAEAMVLDYIRQHVASAKTAPGR